MKKAILGLLCAAILLTAAGCSSSSSAATPAASVTASVTVPASSAEAEAAQEGVNTDTATAEQTSALPNIYLRLGETNDRPVYEIELIDNEVSERFVRLLQDYTRVLPLYVFDGSNNTDVLQYYDIPSSYDIPSGTPELVTNESAGEVYYSQGRIMIFYRDAELEGNFVRIGSTLTTEGLEDAVNSNPLDSWGNRRVTIGIMG